MEKISDSDIRSHLSSQLTKEFKKYPDTVILEEFNLCGGVARIDMAVISSSIGGYEIKSEIDTIGRLPNQMRIYNQVVDNMTIVTTGNHFDNIVQIVPDWWGIILIERNHVNTLNITEYRNPTANRNLEPYSVIQLLWKDEALAILEKESLAKGMTNKSRWKIYEKLISNIPFKLLKSYVLEAIKSRKSWRFA